MSGSTPDERYWSKFSSQLLLPTASAVTSITTCSANLSFPSAKSSSDFAVTSGNRIQLFSSRNRKPYKTITRFSPTDSAHSGHLRRDGRVLVAGGDSGAIQCFDVNSRSILKTWKEHKQPVWVTRWDHGTSQGQLTRLMSCSDDRTVKIWDLAGGADGSTASFYGHGDYVRCGTFMTGGMDGMIVSGSYDRTVRIWDPRSPGKSAAMILKYGAAVEALIPLPSGTGLITAAGNQIAVMDLIAGKPLSLLKNHQKTVTALSLASGGKRLVSGGLDGHVKVFETNEWNVVAGSKYPSPILALAVIPSIAGAGTGEEPNEDKHLVVGMQSSLLSIKTRMSSAERKTHREKELKMQALIDGNEAEIRASASKKVGRGLQKRLDAQKSKNEEADIVVDLPDRTVANKRKRDKTKWRSALQARKYETALDLALVTKNRSDIATCLSTLIHRSALRTALSGRDEASLAPVLTWLIRAVNRPDSTAQAVDVAALVLDLYAPDVAQSKDVWQLMKTLHRRVCANVEMAKEAIRVQGMVDLIRAG